MKNAKKGFTLVEMLIVVAIIAILVAITIPVLNGQLENAREAADAANLRAAYAQASIKVLQNDADATETVTLTQHDSGWTNTSIGKIGGGAVSGIPSTGTVTVKVTKDGVVSFE